MASRDSIEFVFTTCPTAAVAKRIADTLVTERLAACVNIVRGVDSVYRWRGKVERAREWLLVIKARRQDYRRLESRLRAIHPYELPEIVAVPIARGFAPYLSWIKNPDQKK